MKTFVIHVSDAFEREKHIKNELKNRNLDIEFILKGDIKDLSEKILTHYFQGNMKEIRGAVSCAYKHILACEKVVNQKDDVVLILEDDIYCYSNFNNMLSKIQSEIKNRNLSNFIISIEDSTLRYIPRSKRKKGQYLYRENRTRTNVGFLIDKLAAQQILDAIKNVKVNRPIDLYYDKLVEKEKINMYWSQPAMMCQGSIDGSIKTLIGEKRLGFIRNTSYRLQKQYKRLLYFFR